ncbi:MAG: hypothetical protein K0U98_09410 [Deltaproteobacteria bacterium]|nr:hypothetical protein [Deltaproteobacteria bacterium]
MFESGRSFRLLFTAVLGFLGCFLLIGSPAIGENPPEIRLVIQLGDSYSAGFGVLDNNVEAPEPGQMICDDPEYSEVEVTPGFRVAELIQALTGNPVDFVFEACGGAEVYNGGNQDLADQWQAAKGQVADLGLQLGSGEGVLIVMTFGGNDVRTRGGLDWPSLVKECINPFNTRECSSNRFDNEVINAPIIRDALMLELSAIAAEVPNAIVKFMGYPIPFQPVWSSYIGPIGGPMPNSVRDCPRVTGMSAPEADFLDGQSRLVGQFIESAVDMVDQSTPIDLSFVDVAPYFHAHGACNPTVPFINDVDWVIWLWSIQANSFHPMAEGWDQYFWALVDSLGL